MATEKEGELSLEKGKYEVVIVTIGLQERMLREIFASWIDEGVGLNIFWNFRRTVAGGYVFYCSQHARLPDKDYVNIGPIPEFTVWIVGNRIVVQKRFYKPEEVAWLEERGLSTNIALPFIKSLHVSQKKWIAKTGGLGRGWFNLCPQGVLTRKGIFERRIITLSTNDPNKIPARIPSLVARIRQYLLTRGLQQKLDALNKIDTEGRALRGLPPRADPAF